VMREREGTRLRERPHRPLTVYLRGSTPAFALDFSKFNAGGFRHSRPLALSPCWRSTVGETLSVKGSSDE